MKYIVFDIETDGIEANTIHCLSATVYKPGIEAKPKTVFDYDKMRNFFQAEGTTLIGHNIIRYDIPTVERLLGIKVKARLIDTLALSWYLYNSRARHGLEQWGDDLGVKKPEVEDWENEDASVYAHRCEQDVIINTKLFEKQVNLLNRLYEYNPEKKKSVINFLTMMMKVHRNIYEHPFRFDENKCKAGIEELEELKKQSVDIVKSVMPPSPVKNKYKKPAKMYLASGALSKAGLAWLDKLDKLGLSHDHEEEIEVVSSKSEPNPGSTKQVKDWLFSIGWEPDEFTTGANGNEIPQVRVSRGSEKVLADSVLKLAEKEPAINSLSDISVLTHRIGLLKGLLNNSNNGFISSDIAGLTNTLRVRHMGIVNLPGVSRPYGKLVRSCLASPEGKVLVGSDLNSLENMVALHYAKNYDQDYVDRILQPDYDAHLNMALFANILTQEEVDFYKNFDSEKDDSNEYARIGEERSVAKTVNYSATYGVGPNTLSKTIKRPPAYCKKLLLSYWDMHKPLKEIAENAITKVVDGRMWLFNPVVKFWIELRNEKDKFNTLIQSTGSIITYTWSHFVIEGGINLSLVYHDELAALVDKGNEENTSNLINHSIERVNKIFNLEPKMSVGIDFGKTYADIH